MKYTENQLISLKAANPILDIFREKGFKIEKRGRNFATLCPFHPDKNPSLIITPENNLWNCLGCSDGKTGGDVIEFLMKYEKLSFIGAVEYLKKRNSSFISSAKKPAKIKKTSVNRQKLLNRVLEFYHSTFLKDKKGYEYLSLRGITEGNIFNHFKIGYANGTINKTIPEKGEIIEALKETGILTENNHELFKDCVVFPILDSLGNVIHLYGRKIVEEPVKHLYLPGGHKGVFNHTILKSYDEIILTESIIDSLSLYQAGIKNTIPCYGVNGLTENHINLFKENKTKEIIILFDGDEVGRKSAQQLKEKLFNFSCRIVALPIGEDPNSYLLHHTAEDLESIIYGTTKKEKTIEIIKPKEIENGFIFERCQRKYIIRGIEGSLNKCKANLRIENKNKFHIDTVDLYSSRARRAFIRDAVQLFGEEQETVEKDMDHIITATEKYMEEKRNHRDKEKVIIMSGEEKEEALRFGRNKNLIQEILKDIEKSGYIGEEMNKLISYLALTSRKMDDPLSILIISGSGAGKSSLQDTLLNLCPPEDLVKLTSLTGKALFYKKETALSHKVLAIEEERGAEDATYAIRNLISSKVLTIEATIKDMATGKMTTMENTVKGPTSVFKTTTDPATDPETKSRFITLSIDESREQTKRVLQYQRESYTLEGFFRKKEKQQIIERHHNFQRLLKPVSVFNPYAKLLTYLDDRVLVRCEHPKYMNIINGIAFLHQMQREIKYIERNGITLKYIEVTLEDIQLANEIAHTILGKSLSELTEPSRGLLNLIYEMILSIERKGGKSRDNIF